MFGRSATPRIVSGMPDAHDLYPRRSHERVTEALVDTRVVVLNGARQTGKSTLARLVAHGRPGTEIRYLDVAAVRDAAAADPAGFVRHDGLLVIDEVQRVPDLILAIKHAVDLDPRPGQFLLTGSARLFALQQVPDLLPGRSETIELWPLSQGEIDRTSNGLVDAVFELGPDLVTRPSTLHRSDYVRRALAGGYPEAVRRVDPGRRARFFESTASDLISRDVRQLSDIERPADMRRLLGAVAAQMATLVVPGTLAGRLQIPASTLKRYLDLLELLYIVHRIPAWSTNLTTRAVATPKVIVNDSGLAGHLAGITMRRATRPTAPIGPLLENFVLSELARQLSWTTEQIRLYHYRDRDGYEVDAVLEHASGDVVAVEVKAAETVRTEDFRGIQRLARRLGDQLIAGIVLYAGEQSLPFGDRLRAFPISALWTS
jgi:predicted AAA+ superfamily ATPase